MYPILWHFGDINIYNHGVLMLLGILSGSIIVYFLARKVDLQTNFFIDLITLSVLGGLVGARLLYFILYPSQFSAWYQIFFIWLGGMVSFGALLGAILVAVIFLKSKRQLVWVWLDISIVGILIGWAIGRIGCFLTGDVMGVATHSLLAIWGRWPITLFESAWCLILASFCLILNLQKKRQLSPGLIFNFGLGFYGLGRFLIDFLKDENTLFISLKFSQVGDFLTLALAIIFAFVIMKKGLLGEERRENGSQELD